MAHFHSVPGFQRLSNSKIAIDGDSLTVGLWGAKDFQGEDLSVTNDGDGLAILPAGTSGNSALYTIRVSQQSRATHANVSDTVRAVTRRLETWDSFQVEFRYHIAPAADLIVRDVTKEVYGSAPLAVETFQSDPVNMSLFVAGAPGNVLEFIRGTPARPVTLRLFAAKIGKVERCYWLMLPRSGRVTELMIAISHTFGQNDRIYSGLGYSNPFSQPFLDFVKTRFVLGRWGMQVAAARPEMGFLMPVRAKSGTGGGTELGPFISQTGLGMRVVSRIAALANTDFLLNNVDVVTFSNGITDANTFIAKGGKGLRFRMTVNQDPAHGTQMASAAVRKQYLSGYTTGGPRSGFEFLPMPRWKNEPRLEEMVAALGREYLHTWAVPTYTLGMALSE